MCLKLSLVTVWYAVYTCILTIFYDQMYSIIWISADFYDEMYAMTFCNRIHIQWNVFYDF